MIGTLLRMSGAPTKSEIKDMVLRWVVLAQDGGDEDLADAARTGNLLLEVYRLVHQYEDDDDEDAARDPEIEGQDLYNALFKAFANGEVRRIRAHLKARGQDFAHITHEWVREREGFGWFEGFDPETAVIPTSLAKEIGTALGENHAADSIALESLHKELDRERASA